MDKLADITAQGWILAYFIRSDGERFLLGTGAYDFKSDLQHFQPNTMANDIVELQGTDGQLIAGQVRRSATQSFNGYVGDSTQNRERIEELRRDFLMFFRKNFFYKTVYIYPNGTAIQRKRGYLVDAPSVPELYQFFPEYHVALNYEDPNYYEYAEDAHGDEIFANILAITLTTPSAGGLVWDAIGAVSHGYVWSNPQTASGSAFQITGIEGAPLTLTEITGNATQNGTPTPDAPVAVNTTTGEQVVKITGKNLLSLTPYRTGANFYNLAAGDQIASETSANITITSITNGVQLKNSTGWQGAWFLASVSAGNSYFVKYTQSGTNARTTYYTLDSTHTIVRKIAPIASNQFTVANQIDVAVGETYIAIAVGASNSGSTVDFIEPQVELGSTATDYEPYQGEEYPVDLDSIELAKIGNYQDRIYKSDGKWYIEKQIGKVVLDGTQTGIYTSGAHPRYAVGVSGIKRVSLASDVGAIISDHFTTSSVSAIYSGQDGAIGVHNSSYEIWLSNSALTSASDWTTWLTSHPTTVYYALATPTTTEITDSTLLSQLNFIANLYGGTNNIMLVGTGAQGEIEVQYMTEVDTDGAGYEWEGGGGGGNTITLNAVEAVRPVWQVVGPATNPTLTNITTGETISFDGTVPAGQTLTVDMDARTATMAGANVFQFITGDWLRLEPGNNRISYTATGTTEPSTLSWNGVVG